MERSGFYVIYIESDKHMMKFHCKSKYSYPIQLIFLILVTPTPAIPLLASQIVFSFSLLITILFDTYRMFLCTCNQVGPRGRCISCS